jgi:hypothetical protein
VALAAFADLVPDAVGERTLEGLFLPSDFEPAAWFRTARETRDRAFSALVLWAQRTQTMGRVVEAAARTADDDEGELERLARSVRRWEAAFRPTEAAPDGASVGLLSA